MHGNRTSWRPCPHQIQTNRGEVHVWRCPVSLSTKRAGGWVQILSSDERIRAARFVFKKDRVQFIVARAFLRVLLGRYLHRLPEAIRFTYGENGKPGLPAHASDGPFGFNIAHAGDWIVCAVAPSSQIGVDIECAHRGLDVSSLGDSILSDGEQEALRSLPIGERITSFLACWTRKEAYLKSMGLGLQVPLDTFEVSVRPSERPRIVSIDGNQDRAEHWFLEEFSPTERYAGAVVIRGSGWRVIYHDFVFETDLFGQPTSTYAS